MKYTIRITTKSNTCTEISDFFVSLKEDMYKVRTRATHYSLQGIHQDWVVENVDEDWITLLKLKAPLYLEIKIV